MGMRINRTQGKLVNSQLYKLALTLKTTNNDTARTNKDDNHKK